MSSTTTIKKFFCRSPMVSMVGGQRWKKSIFFRFFQIFLPRTPDRSGTSQILWSQIVGLIETDNMIAQSTLSDQGWGHTPPSTDPTPPRSSIVGDLELGPVKSNSGKWPIVLLVSLRPFKRVYIHSDRSYRSRVIGLRVADNPGNGIFNGKLSECL